MACNICWALPQPPKKHSYLLVLVDAVTGREGWIIMQSECAHGAQEWVESIAVAGGVDAADPSKVDPITGDNEHFLMMAPRVIEVDDKRAAHIPIVDPV